MSDEIRVEPDEFYIDIIVDHKTNRSKRHAHAKFGEKLYRVRWKGYESKDDTWEPLPNLTRSHVMAYHESKGLPLPENLEATIVDVDNTSATADEPTDKPTTARQPASQRPVNNVIDEIFDHSFNPERKAWSYRIHWYDLDHSHDSWEPLSNLPRNLIVAYHRRLELPLPADIDEAQHG
jgi:hypothetical protein